MEPAASAAAGDLPKDLYYMKQTISNACGTVAMIHAVANNTDKISLEEAGPLKKFLDATKEATPEERAAKLEADDAICATHDAVAKRGQTAVSGGNGRSRVRAPAAVADH